MAKKKVIKRKKAQGLLDKHPNLIWLTPLLVVAWILYSIIVKP
jgi:hypothetical protein